MSNDPTQRIRVAVSGIPSSAEAKLYARLSKHFEVHEFAPCPPFPLLFAGRTLHEDPTDVCVLWQRTHSETDTLHLLIVRPRVEADGGRIADSSFVYTEHKPGIFRTW